MKSDKRQLKGLRWFWSLVILGILVILGCLGGGGGSGGGGSGPDVSNSGVSIAGRAYFPDRKLYGGIPILAMDTTGKVVASSITDSDGNFVFSSLPPGIYDITANTGDSEVIFAPSQQVTSGNTTTIPTTQLLCVRDSIVDRIGSTSARLYFHSNMPAISTIEYGLTNDSTLTQSVSQSFSSAHEILLSGLIPSAHYQLGINLIGESGAKFKYKGLSLSTSGNSGPGNLSIAVNNGDYETRSQYVKVYLTGDGAVDMKVSESQELDKIDWTTFSSPKDLTLSDTAGTKRVHAQFRDADGYSSPVINDSIVYNSSLQGYLGIWIEDGAAITSKTLVTLTLLFPGATRMRLSASTDFLDSYWEPFLTKRSWPLKGADGEKFVYARFTGGTADPTKTYFTSISLDTSIPTGTVKINGGAAKTATTSVSLSFSFTKKPTSVKISNDVAPASDSGWLSYVTPRSWTISSGDGTKKVFVIFQDQSGTTFGPISTFIDLDTLPPNGNGAIVRQGKDITSAEVTSSLVSALPVFLHFTVADSTTVTADYAVVPSTATGPAETDFQGSTTPFNPVSLDSSSFLSDDNSIYYRFLDDMKNVTDISRIPFSVDGPRLIVSPAIVDAWSGGDPIQFTAVGDKTTGNLGATNWFLTGSGTLTNTGQYTAPNLISQPNSATVRAVSSLQSDVFGNAKINLKTRIELAYIDETGLTRPLESEQRTIGYGSIASFVVKVINSTSPFEIYEKPGPNDGLGSVAISEEQISANEYRAWLIYTAPPLSSGQQIATISVRPKLNPSLTGRFNFIVDSFPIMNLSPTSTSAKPGEGVKFTANVQSNLTQTLNWSLSGGIGSFLPSGISTATSTTVVPAAGTQVHEVTVYGSDTRQIETIEVTATIQSSSKSKSGTLTINPPVKVDIYKDNLFTQPFTTSNATDAFETVAEVGKVQCFVKVTPESVLDTSVTWSVSNSAAGSIDQTGLYAAPTTLTVRNLKIKAQSNYDSSAFKEIDVKLNEFWLQTIDGMIDENTNSPMPVYSVLVDPYTKAGASFTVFAGTNGYGLFYTTFEDKLGSTNHEGWKRVTNLGKMSREISGEYVVNALLFKYTIETDFQGLYAATSNGLFFVDQNFTATEVTGSLPADDLPTDDKTCLSISGKPPDTLFVNTARSVYRLEMADDTTISNLTMILNTVARIRKPETRTGTDPVTLVYPTTMTFYSLSNYSNPFGGTINALAYDLNKQRVYAGGENTVFVFFNEEGATGNLRKGADCWTTSTLSDLNHATDTAAFVETDDPSQFYQRGNIGPVVDVFLGLAIDPNTPSTLWAATVAGVYRSVNYGNNWSGKAFSGTRVNTRCILVDPTNVRNVMSGSEGALYRSTDAGDNWTAIKSGLGGVGPVNALTQANGPPGARRRVWLGTTAGVFLGRQSLDLP